MNLSTDGIYSIHNAHYTITQKRTIAKKLISEYQPPTFAIAKINDMHLYEIEKLFSVLKLKL